MSHADKLRQYLTEFGMAYTGPMELIGDYESAAEALDELVSTLEKWSGGTELWTRRSKMGRAYFKARAALARLRESVPA